MTMKILVDGQPGCYYSLGSVRAPAVGEAILIPADQPDGLKRGEYTVERVVFEFEDTDSPPRVTCVATRVTSRAW